MAGELIRPGVEVLQTRKKTSPSFVRPTLAPVVVGPAFEVIKVTASDGTINSKAKYGAYSQLGLTIAQSAFPNPRSNLDQLDIQESTVRPFMLSGSNLFELLMSTGESFLVQSHGASSAAFQTAVFNGATGLAIQGKILVLAVDNPAGAVDHSKDLTVTFTGAGNLTSAQAAAQINTVAGKTVATVVGIAPNDKVQVASPSIGAMSSISIRAGGSANVLLALGGAGGAHDERVEGSGYRGQDDLNNDTVTPWVEFYVGNYLLDNVSGVLPTYAGLINVETKTFVSAKAAVVTFGTTGTIPLQVGDLFYADGVKVKGGEVSKVEAARFKVGTINTSLSVANTSGRYTSKVYDATSFGTIFDPTVAFAPKYVWFKATGLDATKAAPTAASLTGITPGTAATAGTVTGTGAAIAASAMAGLTLHTIVTIDGVVTDSVFTFTGGPFADMAAVAAAIGSTITGVTATSVTGQLQLATIKTGRLQAVTVKADGTANTVLGFSTTADANGTGTDVLFVGLTGQTLQVRLSNNPHIYNVSFSSDSLNLAVDEVNNGLGYAAASIAGASSNEMKLVSQLKGLSAKVEVLAAGTAATTLGLSGSATGTGRPMPDAYLDSSSNLVIGAQIVRDAVTGYPLDQSVAPSTLYVQFNALRKDVSAVAKDAGVLNISDPDVLSSVLDPISEENPLGLALFLCMLNAPNFEVKGLGVDTVSAAVPYGTAEAYTRAAALLESEEVYAIAPLTQDSIVRDLFLAHCLAMSAPEQMGERIVLFNGPVPTEKNPTVAVSGISANSTATVGQLMLDQNPSAGLVAVGKNPALPFSVADGVFIEFTSGGSFYRYNVKSVSGSLVNVNITFNATENVDAFYSSVALNFPVLNGSYSLKVRGAALTIPGSTLTDYGAVASTISDANAALLNRRGFSIFPDQVLVDVDGVTKTLPGFYAGAAMAGMVASQAPQQGFTNLAVGGLKGVKGTERFSKKQLNIMASGGTLILIQDDENGPVTCRHQLSTDTTAVETREMSITKVVDYVAKFLRLGIRRFIGTQNVNKDLLDTLGTTVQGLLAFLEERGVLNGSNLNQIIQASDAPDTVVIDVTLDVPYPCNYIRLSLVV